MTDTAEVYANYIPVPRTHQASTTAEPEESGITESGREDLPFGGRMFFS